MTRIANAKRLRPNIQNKRWGEPAYGAKQLHVIGAGNRENFDRAKPQPQNQKIRSQKGKTDIIGSAFSGWLMALGHRSKQAYRVSKRLAKSFRDNILTWRWYDWLLLGCSIHFGTAMWLWVLG